MARMMFVLVPAIIAGFVGFVLTFSPFVGIMFAIATTFLGLFVTETRPERGERR